MEVHPVSFCRCDHASQRFVSFSPDVVMVFLYFFSRYYEDKSKRHNVILNVISLEFSCTKLAPIVEGPQVIREVTTRFQLLARFLVS